MEVHHHPDLHHKAKKWKEYLLEFLMIFLAVSLGFLAESLREHLGDQSKESEYIRSLIADLKGDQQVLDHQLQGNRMRLSMMDTMITILNTPSLLSSHSGDLYYLARWTPRLPTIPINNRTFEQLKNSGNFRLIRDIGISNRIMEYYEKIPKIRQIEGLHDKEFDEYKKIAARVFDPVVLRKMEGEDDDINRTTENPPLSSPDQALIKELSVFSIYMRGSRKGLFFAEQDLQKTGDELIQFLEKEYQME